MSRVAIVTGGSSGIGYCAAAALRNAGCTVYEFSRRESPPPGVAHIYADVTDPQSLRTAVDQVMQREGRIDILVNNAGFGISGAAEFTTAGQAHRQMEVNLFGMANTTQAVLPHMRAAGGGRIVNLSSIAAITPIPFQTWYSVSKAAINAYTMAAANEVRPFGITMCAVMPGDVRTGFTDARCKADDGDSVYGGAIGRSVGKMEKDERGGMAPERIGALICRVALKKRVHPFYSAGIGYKMVMFLVKILPAGVLRRLVGLLYAA